jgi:lysophospholipase L1-like esterase
VKTNLSKILDEITTLRGDKPTAIRVVTYYDNTIGDPGTPGAWGFSAADDIAFHEFYNRALDDFDTMMCDVAASNGATCVDLRDAFNGPGHDQAAGSLVVDDHVHPTAAGQTLIATTIANGGFAPL